MYGSSTGRAPIPVNKITNGRDGGGGGGSSGVGDGSGSRVVMVAAVCI